MKILQGDKKIFNKPFMLLTVACGVAACLLSAFRFPVDRVDLSFLVLAAVTIFLGSRICIQFPKHDIQISISDTLVFLIFLLYGAEAAVLTAAADAFCAAFRFSKLWLTVFFNSGVLAVSTFLTSALVIYLFGSPVEFSRESAPAIYIAAVGLMALAQYSFNSVIAAFRESLKVGQPFWLTWKEKFLWASVTYFAGASAAGVTAKLVIGNGMYALAAIFPIIAIIYFTYRSYQKQLEAKTEQAEQAERHAEEQDRISQILRQSEEQFRGAFDYAGIGMALMGIDGRWLKVNRSFRTLVGYSREELLAIDFHSIVHPEDIDKSLADIQRIVMKKTITVTAERRFVHKQGHEIWIIMSASAVTNADGELMHFVVQAQDISERKKAEEMLHQAAFYDTLTALPNRRLFTEHLQLAIERVKQHPDQNYAVLFLDVDRFKNVNDSLGHGIGDQLLIEVARRLEKCVRGDDLVSRFGGDEFVILLNKLRDPTDAIVLVKRIQTEISASFNIMGHEIFCGGSIGIAHSTPDYSQSEDVIRDADTAMYRAKEKGKGRFEIFDKVMHARAISRLQLENDLRRAVEREEFELYYQPIVNLQNGFLTGFEALIRWQHPERGMVSPLDFIPVAEETELIIPIGNWVLFESCRQISEWQKKWDFPAPLTMSVNLSGKQFKQHNLVQQVEDILHRTKLDAQCVRLEITESMLMDNIETTTTMLGQLRALGVQLSIDDFGTGYSSLSYLHRFPVNILKVDRSFVTRMSVDEESLGIVETIITLAAKLKMKVVAEGIETADQRDQLKAFNCELGQGYLFSKPLPSAAAEAFIDAEWQKQYEDIIPSFYQREQFEMFTI